ncbi:hypothetical protein [uncultured Hoeflea sp.]|uniref:hypothetical protein n=1 Tax=uncultured Hoeflea sp. TaxID=538666 RepID=UPI0030DC3D61
MVHELSDMNKSPGQALATSITSTETVDALVIVADVGIDAAITSGAFDGVPILGIATGLIRAGRHIKDELFIRKTARFLAGLSGTTHEARQRFVDDLRANGKIDEFGETILLILDRIDDSRKPLIIGRLMAAHVEGKITYDQVTRLAAIVNRCYAPDLDYLAKFQPGPQGEMQTIADALFSAGLLQNCGLDGGAIGDGLSGGTIYEKNDYAELLIEHGLR